MKTVWRYAVLALLASSTTALAVNVRGRVDSRSPNGVFPMARASVQLCRSQTSNCQTYVTGYDGMYYFNADPGRYDVRVNGTVRSQGVAIPNAAHFDVDPVTGN
jgi:hypothetical protein